MKLNIEKSELLKLLNLVKGATSAAGLPILACVRLEALGGYLSAACTDLDVFVSARTSVSVAAPGGVCVRLGLLLGIVAGSADGDEEEISLAMQGGKLEVKTGTGVYHLSTLPLDEFPPQPVAAGSVPVLLNNLQLQRLLAGVAAAMGVDDSRFVLNGVHLFMGAATMGSEATDGRRLHRLEIPLPEGAPLRKGKKAAAWEAILPAKAVKLLLRLAPLVEADFAMRLGADSIEFSAGSELVICSKLVAGNYPNTGAVIPTGHPHGLKVPRLQLVAALERVNLLGDKCRLEFGAQGLKVCAESEKSQDDGQERLELLVEEPFRVALQVKYLLDALHVVPDAEVLVEYAEAHCPLVVKSAEMLWVAVIMPLRQDQTASGRTAADAAQPEVGRNEEEDKVGDATYPRENGKHPTSNIQPSTPNEDEDATEKLVAKVTKAISDEGKCSLSLIQRWLHLSYSAANDLLDVLQKRGIVGQTIKSGKGAGTQPVLITLEK